jgi:hypothetical protein
MKNFGRKVQRHVSNLFLSAVYITLRIFRGIRDELTPIISDFQGSATVSVASVGVPPMDRCAPDNFTRSVAIRALR